MSNRNQKLALEQVSGALEHVSNRKNVPTPVEGWIRTIRKAINMSIAQLATRIEKKPPSVSDFEKREQQGTITLKSLQQIADALDMKLIYAIVPKEGSLEDLVTKAAKKKADEIVDRANITMSLEDQQNSKQRLMKAKKEKTDELMNELPKFLWD